MWKSMACWRIRKARRARMCCRRVSVAETLVLAQLATGGQTRPLLGRPPSRNLRLSNTVNGARGERGSEMRRTCGLRLSRPIQEPPVRDRRRPVPAPDRARHRAHRGADDGSGDTEERSEDRAGDGGACTGKHLVDREGGGGWLGARRWRVFRRTRSTFRPWRQPTAATHPRPWCAVLVLRICPASLC